MSCYETRRLNNNSLSGPFPVFLAKIPQLAFLKVWFSLFLTLCTSICFSVINMSWKLKLPFTLGNLMDAFFFQFTSCITQKICTWWVLTRLCGNVFRSLKLLWDYLICMLIHWHYLFLWLVQQNLTLRMKFITDSKKFNLLLLFTISIIVISLLVKKFSFSYVWFLWFKLSLI